MNATTLPPRSMRYSATSGTLTITDRGVTTSYFLDTLASSYGRGWTLTKFASDGTESYETIIDTDGEGPHSCTCKGWQHRRNNKPCRHVASLVRLIELGRI